MTRAIIRKLFAVDSFFTIAIKERDEDVLKKQRFCAINTLPATRDYWCADPFLAEDGDRTYLFFERVHGDLGSIEVAEVGADCKLSEPSLLFGGELHYSYPYVFQKDGNWYMIPESSAQGEIAVYAASRFPYEWEKETVLLHEPGVDTTVFQVEEQWYLLTFLPVPGSERVHPRAYRLRGSKLDPLQWIQSDPLCARGAGRPFKYGGDMIRPVQINTDVRYGDRVAFVKMEISGDQYREIPLMELTPNEVRAGARFYDGLHTYNASEHYEVIDIRCGTIRLQKPLKKIICALFKR